MILFSAMFSKRLHQLTPYTPGEQPQDRSYIKLNTNENPYPPAPQVAEYLKTLDIGRLRLYPDPEAVKLRGAISKLHDVDIDSVFVGNGSDEVLSFAFYAFFEGSLGPVLFPEITYSFYPVYCKFYQLPSGTIPLREDFSIDLYEFTQQGPCCGIIFPNPNAPTGIFQNLDRIETFLNAVSPVTPVIIDEAYIDFGGESAVTLLPRYNNLIIVRTLSKSRSLAGIRLGYAVGNPEMIAGLRTTKDSFNSYPVDTLSQKIGEIAVENDTYYREINSKIIATRENLSGELRAMGWNVLPSKANFVFAGKPGIAGQTIYKRLKRKGILVRFFNSQKTKDFVRITVGTDDETAALLNAVRKIFS